MDNEETIPWSAFWLWAWLTKTINYAQNMSTVPKKIKYIYLLFLTVTRKLAKEDFQAKSKHIIYSRSFYIQYMSKLNTRNIQ